MSIFIVLIAVGMAILLGLFLVLASSNTSSGASINSKSIDWHAMQDNELQSYLPEKKISAIKRYRDLTGAGLKTAKLAVEYAIANPDSKRVKGKGALDTGGAGVRDLLLEGRVEEAIDIYAAFMGVDTFTARDAIKQMQGAIEVEAVDLERIRRLVDDGDRIEAIKIYQEQTGVSLAEAKRIIDGL